MVGICGALGDYAALPPEFTESVSHRDEETRITVEESEFTLHGSFHSVLAGEQPATAADGDVRIWVWGDVYGYDSGSEHVARSNGRGGSADFCARLYDAFGMEFVAGLNGDYALVVHDAVEETLSFVTDRLATRPVFYARPDDDTFVFSSASQTLTTYPGVDATFDLPYLYEYLQLRRVFGVKTPLAGIEELPPASVVTVDLEDLSTETWTYWTPSYEPVDKPFSAYLDEFVDTVTEVLEEWTDDDLDYGLLLSGGSDSRLIQAAMDQPMTTFHNADFMSREARVARRAATVSGDEFRLLERDEKYDARLLEETPPLSNFSGWFDQAYFSGFEAEIVEEVDVLVAGLYADMLFGGNPLATYAFSVGDVGTLSLPIRRPVDSIEDYIDLQTKDAIEPLPYFDSSLSLKSVLRSNIRRDGDGVVSHGVRYGSLQDLVMYGDFYPMGGDTDAIFSRTLMQMRPYRTPFLDNRLLELAQKIPVRYLLRRNLVDAAVTELDPGLASIPHARTGVPLKHPFAVSYLGDNVYGLWRKHVADESPPEPHLTHTPWPNRQELVRAKSFTEETLSDRRQLLEDFEFFDFDGAMRCYDDHLNGINNQTVLYSLLTILNMPATRRAHTALTRSTSSTDSVATDGVTDTPTGVTSDE
ncbi:asparagine synthase (glutamine-hydrolysing) [Halogranum amylolyticum]|uniref:Asparagine synthase (Glutamine-hydrolysing) n=1 Tax=Halogranum amylolyticum TaxID=660520 RepID=A0A1H8NI22_9EURY|nr:asparagine synthase-related protein [Halogranum amylolyticum]SEO29270.1 asparagine synthase (glutamine-hydrolysing) [Halogranum amylolyticum]